MKTHELKTWPAFYRSILNGEKTFEIRKDDRCFRSGDILKLKEWNPSDKSYTGRETKKKVVYVLSGWGLEKDYVCMSLGTILSHSDTPACNE